MTIFFTFSGVGVENRIQHMVRHQEMVWLALSLASSKGLAVRAGWWFCVAEEFKDDG